MEAKESKQANVVPTTSNGCDSQGASFLCERVLTAEGASYSELARYFELAPSGLLVVDDRGTVHRTNELAQELMSEVSVVGHQVDEFVASTARSSLVQWLGELGAARETTEVTLRPHSFRPRLCTLSFAAIRLSLRPPRFLVSFSEISEFKETVVRCRRSERRWREMIDAMPVALVVVCEGRVTVANTALGELFECPVQEAIGAHFVQFAVEQDREGLATAIAESRKRGVGETHFRLASTQQTVDSRIVSLTCGENPSAVLILQDGTKLRRSSTGSEHSSRLASLGMLVAGVAHEINNPLTFVLPNLEDALERLSSVPPDMMFGVGNVSDARELIYEAQVGVKRVANIVKDLKTFHKVKEEIEAVEVNQVVVNTLKMAVPKLGNRVIVDRDLGKLPPIMGNSGRLGQVVLNLILNASQSMPTNRSRGVNQICVKTWHGDAGVHLEVQDNGAGIAEEDIPKLFDPFYSNRQGGTGLGLTVCSSLVREMGGWIEVDSCLGKGTRLVLRFPALASIPDVAPKPSPSLPVALDGLRLLVVDDEPLIFRTIRRVLGRKFQLVQALSGMDAIRKLEAGLQVDAVLTDVVMTEGTGLELYMWLQKARPELAERLVFMTGMAHPETLEQFPDRPHLQKPFSMNQVEEALSLLEVNECQPTHCVSEIRELSLG